MLARANIVYMDLLLSGKLTMARLGPAAAGGTVRGTVYELALFIIRNDH